jgi:tetratricopeptide (TPR) repeat protein
MKLNFFYIFITLALCALATTACVSDIEAEPPGGARHQETVPAPELIRQADELFRQRADLEKLRQAVALLKRARSADEKNFEAAWKTAQFSYFLGKDTPDDKESDKVFSAGITAAIVATRLEPNKPEGYFWLGACYGGEAERNPFTKGITAVDKIRAAMTKVIEIDPGYQGATAFDALATVELKTTAFGGKPEKAAEYLEKGLQLNPENFLSRLHLAEAYLALDRDAEAKKQLEYLLKIKPPDDLRHEYNQVEKEARKMLDRKF